MGRRGRHARGVREAGLTVHFAPRSTGLEVTHGDPDEAVPDGPVAAGCDAADPEEYGVRVVWQSEAVKIEAAEFLLATRTQHEARIRATHELERRHHPDAP